MALYHIREDNTTVADWKLLSTRVQMIVSHEIGSFKDALRIYSTKDSVSDFNYTRLVSLGTPAIISKASHTGRDGVKASTLRDLPQGFDMWQYHGSSLWQVCYLRGHLIMSVWLQAAH
jgi:hypothetical protein